MLRSRRKDRRRKVSALAPDVLFCSFVKCRLSLCPDSSCFSVVELSKLKGQFEVQRNAVASEVGRLRSDLTMIFEKRQEIVELKTNLEEKFKLLTEEEAVYQEAIVREKNRKERLQKAIRETIRGSDQKAIELEELVENLNIAERRLTDVDRYVVEQRVNILNLEVPASPDILLTLGMRSPCCWL